MQKGISAFLSVCLIFLSGFGFFPGFAQNISPLIVNARQSTTTNQIVLDVTINKNGEVSFAGFTPSQLRSAGMEFVADTQVVNFAQKVSSLHMVIQGQQVSLEVNGLPLLNMEWNAQSRQTLIKLLAKYGVNLSKGSMDRIEEWATTSDIDLTVRSSEEISKSPTILIPKEFNTDVAADGSVSVENISVGYAVPADILNLIKKSGVNNSDICFNKGTLNLSVDGNPLPSVQLDQKGVDYLNKTLGITDADLSPVFAAQLGVNVAFGAAHTPGASCK